MPFEWITVEADKMGDMPCIRGLRMPVATVVTMVADGMTVEEILTRFPQLEPEVTRVALLYAPGAVRERGLPLTPTS
jgi:uncharacterized protein (DUF433 family)